MTPAPMLLCYDIRDPRRLQRVWRCARRAGIPLQYSVFYLKMTLSRLNELLADIDAIIDAQVDDVRVYHIGGMEEIVQLGEAIMPEGIFLG